MSHMRYFLRESSRKKYTGYLCILEAFQQDIYNITDNTRINPDLRLILQSKFFLSCVRRGNLLTSFLHPFLRSNMQEEKGPGEKKIPAENYYNLILEL